MHWAIFSGQMVDFEQSALSGGCPVTINNPWKLRP